MSFIYVQEWNYMYIKLDVLFYYRRDAQDTYNKLTDSLSVICLTINNKQYICGGI